MNKLIKRIIEQQKRRNEVHLRLTKDTQAKLGKVIDLLESSRVDFIKNNPVAGFSAICAALDEVKSLKHPEKLYELEEPYNKLHKAVKVIAIYEGFLKDQLEVARELESDAERDNAPQYVQNEIKSSVIDYRNVLEEAWDK